MSGWDKRWMDLTLFIAEWSKDRSRKTAAAIVDNRNVLISIGWNGFPRGVDDYPDERYAAPEKYLWTIHAEENAVCNAAAKGLATLGCIMYLPWYPCASCSNHIIQAGISELVCVEPNWQDSKWGAHFVHSKEKLAEAEVHVRYLPGYEPPQGPLLKGEV